MSSVCFGKFPVDPRVTFAFQPVEPKILSKWLTRTQSLLKTEINERKRRRRSGTAEFSSAREMLGRKETLRAPIHSRMQSSPAHKQLNSDWVRVRLNGKRPQSGNQLKIACALSRFPGSYPCILIGYSTL